MSVFTAINRVTCAALAGAILSVLLACSSGPPRTEAQIQADKDTTNRVYDALGADKLLYSRHITVKVRDGQARLSGVVWDPNDIYEAQRITANVTGVTSVVNNLELNRNGIDNSQVSR